MCDYRYLSVEYARICVWSEKGTDLFWVLEKLEGNGHLQWVTSSDLILN